MHRRTPRYELDTCGSTSGLIRNSTLTLFPEILAAATMFSKSNSLSMFTKTPASAAKTRSSKIFPFPLKTHLCLQRTRYYNRQQVRCRISEKLSLIKLCIVSRTSCLEYIVKLFHVDLICLRVQNSLLLEKHLWLLLWSIRQSNKLKQNEK